MNTIFTLSIVIFCLGVVSSLKFHSQTDGTVQRLFEVFQGPHAFEIIAARRVKGTGKADAVEFIFDTTLVPFFVVRYLEHNGDSNDLMAARWMIWKIVEFQDVNSDLMFTPGIDTLVSDFKLWGQSWSIMSDTHTTTSTGINIHEICTQLNGISPHPDVQFCIIVSDNATTVHGIATDPNSLKWNITISNYAYQGVSSRLALKASFSTRQVVETFTSSNNATYQPQPNEAGFTLSTAVNGAQAIAGYVSSVGVVGTGCSSTAPINSTVIRSGQWSGDVDTTFPSGNDTTVEQLGFTYAVQVAYYSFATDCVNPTTINWDPEIGVYTPPSNGAGINIPSFIAITFFSILALFIKL